MKRKLPQVASLPHDAPDIPEATPEHLLPEKPEGYSRLVISRKPQQSFVIDCNGVQVQIRQRCLEIQQEWPDEVRRQRDMREQPVSWSVPRSHYLRDTQTGRSDFEH